MKFATCFVLIGGLTLFLCIDVFAQSYQWPVTNGKVSDYFGTRNGQHYGIDIAANVGTDVIPIAEGVVSKSYVSASYGQVIFISHPNGYESVYAHLQKRNVEEGDKVAASTVIGKVGNTGHSRGNHLHLEIHAGKWNYEKTLAINPLELIDSQNVEQHVSGNTNTYKVKEGDTLSSIARDYHTTVDSLKRENELANDLIFPDQVLLIQ